LNERADSIVATLAQIVEYLLAWDAELPILSVGGKYRLQALLETYVQAQRGIMIPDNVEQNSLCQGCAGEFGASIQHVTAAVVSPADATNIWRHCLSHVPYPELELELAFGTTGKEELTGQASKNFRCCSRCWALLTLVPRPS
jgi:hypothetical protein